MTKELNEISGLHSLNEQTILAIQDEQGILYFLNHKTFEIDSTIIVVKKGDFEGVAANEQFYFMLRSDGTVFCYDRISGSIQKLKFPEKGKFDFEGICTLSDGNTLLVACKTHGVKSKNKNIWIFGIDVEKLKYDNKPAYKISKNDINSSKDFQPSGITVNSSGDIYLISSVAKSVLILNQHLAYLEKSIHQQPEGITIDNLGGLYISNEKKNSTPNIHFLSPK